MFNYIHNVCIIICYTWLVASADTYTDTDTDANAIVTLPSNGMLQIYHHVHFHVTPPPLLPASEVCNVCSVSLWSFALLKFFFKRIFAVGAFSSFRFQNRWILSGSAYFSPPLPLFYILFVLQDDNSIPFKWVFVFLLGWVFFRLGSSGFFYPHFQHSLTQNSNCHSDVSKLLLKYFLLVVDKK